MIYLNNVHIDRVIDKNINSEILRLIKENNATSIEDLIKLRYNYPEIDWKDMEVKLIEISKDVYRNNNEKKNLKYIYKNPQIYTFEPYKDERLSQTDQLVKGNELIKNPNMPLNNSMIKLECLSIKEIKEYLSHTDEYGKNYLEYVTRSKKGTITNQIPWLLTSLDIYKEQIISQSRLTDKDNIDFFHYQEKEKKEIITEEYYNIINYILDTDKEYIWGYLTEDEKRKLYKTIQHNGKSYKETKDNIITLLSHYTTLPETKKISKKPEVVLKKLLKKKA